MTAFDEGRGWLVHDEAGRRKYLSGCGFSKLPPAWRRPRGRSANQIFERVLQHSEGDLSAPRSPN